MVHRLAAIVGTGTCIVAVTVGCGGSDSAAPQTTTPNTVAPIATTQTSPPAPAVPAPGRRDTAPIAAADAAIRTAAAAVPNGRPFNLEIDSRGNEQVFDVKVASDANEFNILVDSTGNRVVSQQQENRPDDDIAKLQGIQVDAGQALATVGEQAADALFDEMEIDTEDGNTVVWKVQVVRPDGAEIEYEVDAHTGAVIISR